MTKDLYEAVKWFRKAAEQGHAKAQFNLGLCYDEGNGVTKDPVEAVKWYRKAAEQGDAKAQYNLGFCYYNGSGVAKDPYEAVKWYHKAAEQGHAKAQHNLGLCYVNGDGVTKDLYEAVKWFRKAAEQGEANAQFNLGLCYYKGYGVAKNRVEAVKWYRKAAEQGDAKAQNNLGWCYNNGFGVAKNRGEAIKWYRKAAEQGQVQAQYSLGVMCFKNDLEESFKWLSKAAKQGDKDAKEFLEKPEFSLVRLVRGNVEDIEAGEVCLQKLKDFKKDRRFDVTTPAPQNNDTLVIKGLYIGMPVDDAVVACGKIAATSDNLLVFDSRMLKDEKWSQFKVLKDKVNGLDGVCILSCKKAKRIQDATPLCVVRLNGERKVRQIFFTETGMGELFKARDLSTAMFAKALIDNYQKIPSLRKTVSSKQMNRTTIREYQWTYAGRGYTVELYENTLVIQGREINRREYKAIMANDPNVLGVAFGESLFDKYFCISANTQESKRGFD